jgi:hypothetical protein
MTAVLFLHIRKTAGMSFRNFMANRFAADACLFDAHYQRSPPVDPAAYELVSGHVGYDFISRFPMAPAVVTCLRDPVERALSNYHYYRSEAHRTALARRAELDSSAEVERIRRQTEQVERHTLAELIRQAPEVARAALGNVQTRALAGVDLHDGDPALSDQELLDRAIDHLERCTVILLTERAAESLPLLCRTMGWEEDVLPRDNVSAGRPRVGDLDRATHAALSELTRLDAALYRHACDLFEERLRSVPKGPGLKPVPPGDADFTFDRAVPGTGWHPRERGPEGWFCWSGPVATLHLRLAGRGAGRMRLRVVHALSAQAIDGLLVWVNGGLVPTRRLGEGLPADLEADIPAHLVRDPDGRVELRFRPGATMRACDVSPGSQDERPLGVALSRVSVSA